MTSHVSERSVKLMSVPLMPPSISCHKYARVRLPLAQALAQARFGNAQRNAHTHTRTHAQPTSWKDSHPCASTADTYLHMHAHAHIFPLQRRETRGGKWMSWLIYHIAPKVQMNPVMKICPEKCQEDINSNTSKWSCSLWADCQPMLSAFS